VPCASGRGAAGAQNLEPCSEWQPEVTAAVATMLGGMGVPAGDTLETLCPARCQTPACLVGAPWGVGTCHCLPT
jgi:hypothetical protein